VAGLQITTGGDAIAASERFSAGVGEAIYRSVLKGALLLGRHIAENVEAFKETIGTRHLARSFLVPEPDGPTSFMLGAQSPIYARIHEYGGTIKPIHGEYLIFETPDGIWHAVKEVTIREKRYARDAIEEFEKSQELPSILAAELTAEFSA
jgi:hypothetical protein